jgi:tetratricopeptide (TPR) repeat protein
LIEAQQVTPSDPRIGVALNNLASIYCAEGKYIEAERSYERSLAILERALGPSDPYLAGTVLNNFAQLYVETGQPARAEMLLDHALAIAQGAAGNGMSVAAIEDNLAAVYIREGLYRDARRLLEDALAICTRLLGPEDARNAPILNNLAAVAFETAEPEQALAYSRRALEILEKRPEQRPADFAKVVSNLGLFYSHNGDNAAAEECFKRALAVAQPILGADHPVVGAILGDYAGLLRRTHRKSEAKSLELRAKAIQSKSVRNNPLGMTIDAKSLLPPQAIAEPRQF